MDWPTIAAVAGPVIAVIALAFSAWQWRESRESDRLKLLLGEKSTVGFEASRIANSHAKGRARLRAGGGRFRAVRAGWRRGVSKDVLDALILAALFEASDRARLQVYRALDELEEDDRKRVAGVRMEYVRAAEKYEDGLDLKRFYRRLGQLDSAVRWIRAGESENAHENDNETHVKKIGPESGTNAES